MNETTARPTIVVVSAPRRRLSLNWQCAALAASARKHLGEHAFVRLVAEHSRLGIEYPPINRSTAIVEWLRENPELRKRRIVVCDPDIFFLRPIEHWPRPGEMFADRFSPAAVCEIPRLHEVVEFLELSPRLHEVPLAHTGVMVFHGEDLWRVCQLAEPFTEKLRELLGSSWQVDMYALYVAVAALGITVNEVPLAAPLDWPVTAEAFSAIHYCQPMKLRDGSVWHKHMLFAWERLRYFEATAGTSALERTFIEAVKEVSL